MFSFRITKYNPQYRDLSNRYTLDEWTAVSDVGKIYQNKKFTFEEYLQVESAYINAVMIIMDFLGVDFLHITHLEKKEVVPLNIFYCSSSLRKMYQSLHGEQKLNKEEIIEVMQLVLREFIWCKLESQKMFVHFGWDYYMYIGTPKELSKLLIQQIEKSGLYVEEFYSPYLE